VRVIGAAQPLGGPTLARAARARLGRLRAAEIVGLCEGAYALTRDYVRTREQFGKPLVRIPAVAMNLARMRTAIIPAQRALWRGQAGDLDSAAVARVLAGRAATEVARLAHQLHGAMGVTSEYPLQRFTRRLWSLRDADLCERDWSAILAEASFAGGEPTVWEVLTS
jgi:acyl-CoA dehydrogenase